MAKLLNEKDFSKDIKKLTNEISHLCKKLNNEKINKLTDKLKERVNTLHISDLEEIKTNKDLLQKRFDECTELRKDSQKILSEIQAFQLDLIDLNQKLDEKNNEVDKYISELSKMSQNGSMSSTSTYKMLLQQQKNIIDTVIKENVKLKNDLAVIINVAMDTFTNYINKIAAYQRKLWE